METRSCTRCRRQKIKCSGSQPCNGCSKRNLTCTFDERDQKVLVSRGYIIDLQREIASLKRVVGQDPASPGSDYVHHDPDRTLEDLYLGTSSNWSFARRVLTMTHEYKYRSPLPPGTLLFDATAYDLGWDGFRTALPDTPLVPAIDHAIYLINSVKFRCGQLFHLFEEEEFMISLYNFYADPAARMAATGLWYIHFLVILAFGKAFVLQKNQGKKPPGSEFFVTALRLLPDVSVLCGEPIISTEIMCCITLYFQSLDFRHSAHNFIGQAKRMALGQGMHTDMPIRYLGEALVQRCRKIWWTVYILDREMTSLMGLPQAINDNDVQTPLPTFLGSVQRTQTLNIQIKLSRIIAEINSTIYGIDGRLNTQFLLSTKSTLASIANLADELRQLLPMPLDKSVSGVSRLTAYIHILYHQCIVLATRPLIFFLLKIRLESPGTILRSLNSSPNVRNLPQMCIDSSQQMVNILSSLQSQGLLETFLHFDLESIFVSAVILLISPVIDVSLLDNGSSWLQKSYVIIDEMISNGNLIAEFRKSELQQLEETLNHRLPDLSQSSSGLITFQQNNDPTSKVTHSSAVPLLESLPVGNDIMPSDPTILDDCDFSEGLTAAQILAVANSIDTEDAEWVSHAMTGNNIW
ncbi:Zn(II)2Cys6 transcription factor [Xylogone sp. PMI_703]|nr:Zn(II)2Cys6 transcription factor [Xylogone sp. PMI_703]